MENKASELNRGARGPLQDFLTVTVFTNIAIENDSITVNHSVHASKSFEISKRLLVSRISSYVFRHKCKSESRNCNM